MSRQPPLPTSVRPFFWVMRVWGALIGLAAACVAVLAFARDSWPLAVLVLAVGAGFAALTWMHPLGRWFAPLFGLIGFGMALVVTSWGVAAVVALVVGLLLWQRTRPIGRRAAHINPDRIVEVDKSAAMKNARAFVQAFEKAGFEQVGALQLPIGPIKVIESLLLAPDRLSYAAVTDAVVHLVSLFPGDRGLTTRNSGFHPLPEYLLADEVPGGSPGDLIESHARALAVLAKSGHHPRPISAAELLDVAIEGERNAIAWARRQRSRSRQRAPRGAFSQRDSRLAEVAAWSEAHPDSPTE